jgi:tRNA-specific 2-thiouridylase
MKTVFIGMSGGVDSSVAAHLLKEQGYNTVGVFLRSFNLDGCQDKDAEDARRVAGHLNIPFYVWDVEKEYKEKVVDYMVRGYEAGITPNPDVMCNKEIKFGIFFKRAMALGADFVATGHYIRKENGKLFIAKDKNKDQSYFLWALGREQIEKSLFPIGDYLKPEVRAIAREAGIPTADKKDSQGVCFLGQITLTDFLKQYIPERRGKVINSKGVEVGEHNGAHFYTIGQRRGLGLGGNENPVYVSDKIAATNTLVVAEGGDESLSKAKAGLTGMNFVSEKPELPLEILARVRYRQPLFEATLTESGLKFAVAQKFVAPGQSAVVYSKDGELLGGGIIV